jgi:hypothetical protein
LAVVPREQHARPIDGCGLVEGGDHAAESTGNRVAAPPRGEVEGLGAGAVVYAIVYFAFFSGGGGGGAY